jgi:predicted acetyltransferase
MLSEWTPLSDACKAKALKGQKRFYYIFFIATAENWRKNGLCSKMISYWQEKAKCEGLPIWLEATTEYSMKLYVKLGFEVVDTILLGKGNVTKEAVECKGGEGVTAWGMVWWPKGT